MFHVDDDPVTLPVDAPILGIARYFAPEESKARFGEVFDGVRHHLERAVGGQELVIGGWKIEEDDERIGNVERVLFSDWESVEKHREFARTE